MNSKRVKVILVFVVFICSICVLLLINRRQDVSLDQLLVDQLSAPLPTEIKGEIVSNINWSINEKLVHNNSLAFVPNEHQEWFLNGQSNVNYQLKQQIANYQSPVFALFLDMLFPLERTTEEEYGNLISEDLVENRYPSSWVYESNVADRELVICAEGIPSECNIWLYRARYGQYMVLIEFRAFPYGSDENLFAQLVEQVDKHISSQLN